MLFSFLSMIESPYSHNASPRLRTLRAQNEQLITKQIHLEEQLKEQQQQQQQLMERLVQKGLLASQDEDTVSLLQQTQSKLICPYNRDRVSTYVLTTDTE